MRATGGSIRVTGGDPSAARIEVYVHSHDLHLSALSKDEIKKRLEEDYEFSITTENHKLKAVAKLKGNFNWKRSLSISFEVYVPTKCSSDIVTSGGSISLSDLSGNASFETSGGSLHLDKLNGKINGKTSGGSIEIASSQNDISLHTSGGGIRATDCSGTIRLETSGGTIHLEDLSGNITAKTSGGSINGNTVKGELLAHTSGGSVLLKEVFGSVDATTSGGNIDVDINSIDQYITLTNSGGRINLTMPGNKGLNLNLHGNKVKLNTMTNFNGGIEDDSIDGTINGGGIPVTARTSGGGVSVTLKQ